MTIESLFIVKTGYTGEGKFLNQKIKHHVVSDNKKSTIYVKNGKKRLVFLDLFFIIKLGYC